MVNYFILGIVIAIAVVIIVQILKWYTIVPPSEAHLVVTPKKRMVVSPDEKIATDERKIYFDIPEWVPFIGRSVRILDMTIKELKDKQETYEKDQARYSVTTSIKYRIRNVQKAAETFNDEKELEEQLLEVLRASVRAVTVKYNVVEARANKKLMDVAIREEMQDDLERWGLELINMQLVDFQDTHDSKIISDISKRREVEIEAQTREQNAEKRKQARIKEAEAEEKAKQREIERDRVIGEREQEKKQLIAVKATEAQRQEYEVKRVQIVKQAEIDKEQAIVKANEDKETEKIRKEQKQLQGMGDRLRDEERAKGEAAPIREKGFAEAEAKDKLQAALNKFKDEAIRALVAEKIVEMQKVVGVETAHALADAEVKLFAGGSEARSGFDFGQMLAAMNSSTEGLQDAVLNRIARPNDLGISKEDIKLEGKKK